MIQIKHQSRQTNEEVKSNSEAGWEKLLKREDLGFIKLPERHELWECSKEHGRAISKKYKKLAIVGIGGSSLGVKAIHKALSPYDKKDKLLFFENVDAFQFWEELESNDLASIHWAFITKSGSTLETLSQLQFISEFMKEKKLKLHEHSTVVSELKDNLVTAWAKEYNVPQLEIPVDVGGRFSVLSPVGIFPAAFLGLDTDQMRIGAEWALQQKALVCELSSQSLSSFKNNEWITLFWSYSERLKYFGEWFQQLWAESLGKALDREGQPAPRASSPFPCVGARDQHSILQQVAEGYRDKFVWFFREAGAESYGPKLKQAVTNGFSFLEGQGLGHILRAEAEATRQSLAQSGVQSLTVKIDNLNEGSLGALFMLLELVIGVLGEAHNINAYDQPGVEAGKKLARQLICK